MHHPFDLHPGTDFPAGDPRALGERLAFGEIHSLGDHGAGPGPRGANEAELAFRADVSARVTAVVPAAGRVPEGMIGMSSVRCPAMIPVAGRPVAHWTLRYLRSLGVRRFVIAVAERGLFIEDFLDGAFGGDAELEFIVPSRDGGLGLTVKELLDRVRTPSSLVVLGDTHFQFADPTVLAASSPTVLVSEVAESYRWCIADTDETGVVRALRDKEANVPGPLEALIGVYYFPDAELAREAAAGAVETKAENGRGRVEMSAVLGRIAETTPLRAVRAGDWLDVGNPDRQASSHKALLQKREFNELTIDPTFGTITKRSRHVEKFVDEINYLRLLPPDLAVLYPRVLSFSTEWDAPHVTMEYYGYPALADSFVFDNVHPSAWQQVFEHLHDVVVRGFMSRSRPISADAIREMYLGKTKKRLAAIEGPPELVALVRHPGNVEVNGRVVRNLPALWPALEAAVERLATTVKGSIVHGDMCLSNVLYDFRSRICKLVDPRGSFGTPGIFGDPRYDVAKLYHSVYGLYDFIVSDLFRVQVDVRKGEPTARVRLELRTRAHHTEIRRRFEEIFFQSFDRRDVLLLTGLLFASMPALHYDAPRRQLAMYTRALELLDEALGPALPV